jgi:hypothetical protein
VGKSDEIRIFTRSRCAALGVEHRIPRRLIELLKLGQNFGAEFNVVMANQDYAPAKLFVDRT